MGSSCGQMGDRTLRCDHLPSSIKARGCAPQGNIADQSGMVLPFTPLTLSFHHVDYFVPLSKVRAGSAAALPPC